MGARLADLLDAGDGVGFSSDADGAVVGYLTAHFGIERSVCRDDGDDAVLLMDFENGAFAFVLFGADEFGDGVRFEVEGADDLALAGGAGAFALFFHECFEAVRVDGELAFFRQQGGEVDREAEGVVELEGEVAGDFALRGGFGIEEVEATVECFVEGGFFAVQRVLDGLGACGEFREDGGHLFDEGVDEFRKEGFHEAELAAVADGAAQDAAEDIVAAVVARQDAVRNGEAEGADVVGDDAEGDGFAELLLVVVDGFGSALRVDVRIGAAAELLKLCKEGAKTSVA